MRLHVSISLLIVTSCFVITIDSKNILAVFPLPSRSHFVMFQRLMERLADRGHNVDVVSYFPREQPLQNYKDYSLVGIMPLFYGNVSIELVENMSVVHLIRFMTNEHGAELCHATFSSPNLKQILMQSKKSDQPYDLVITEIFGADCMLGFGYVFKTPTISVISSVALPWAGDRLGNPDNPAYIPTYYSHGTQMYRPGTLLFGRVLNVCVLIVAKVVYWWANWRANQVSREFFGESLPDLQQLARNTSLVLVNSHFTMNQVRPMVPNFVEVGGLHIKAPQPLSVPYQKLLNSDDNDGIILFTMGSMIAIETFALEKLQAFCNAFRQLPRMTVLWRGERRNIPSELDVPPNVIFEKWLPQIDLLCHDNTKVFISHGGLMGSQEAVYCGVPRLGIPLFADQEGNIQQAEDMGVALRVGYHEITEERLLAALRKLLQDPTYREKTKRLSQLFKDRPMSALDTAVYWVEYVMKYNGATHLRSLGADMPWYQYHLIDVAVVLSSFFIFSYHLLSYYM